MVKYLTVVILLGSTLLYGCLEKKTKQPEVQQKVVIEVIKPKEETIQTVTWFKEHKEERLAMLSRCNENPGELGNSPNCVNASRAENELDAAKQGGLGVKPIENIYEMYKNSLRNNSSTSKQNNK